jgi:hypothetical protein
MIVMQCAHVKLNPALPWQKQRSVRRRLFTRKLELNLRQELVKCYMGSIAVCGVETWTFRKVDKNSWNVLKCGTGEGWRRSVTQSK